MIHGGMYLADQLSVFHLLQRPALCRGGRKRIPQDGSGEAFPVELLQDMYIVKIPHARVGDIAADNRLQFFGQHRFQIVGPHLNGAILQHELEAVPDFTGRNHIPGGNVYF